MKTAIRKALLGAGAVVAGIAGSLALGALGTTALTAYAADASTSPVISGVSAMPQSGGTSASITWTTDVPSSSQVNYGTTTAHGIFSMLGNTTTPVTSHSVMLSSLLPNTLYHFVVLSGVGTSTAVMSNDQTFTTGSSSAATSTLPMISNITSTPTNTGATLVWQTDVPATSQVNYGTTTSYGASSPLDTTKGTNHSVTLSGLTSGTTYHFQILSGNSAGVSSSTDQNFMTGTPTPTTTMPVISGISATPGLMGVGIAWTTDVPSTSQVLYGLTNQYGATSSLNSATTTNHSVSLGGFTSGTLYHYAVRSGNSAGVTQSGDQTFTTLAPTTTPDDNGNAARIAALQHVIDILKARLAALEARLNALIGGGNGNNGGGNGTTTPPVIGPAYIDQDGHSYQAGGQIDFGGHGFLHEENVAVMLNGQQVGSAHADGGGNFSTGSMTLPTTPGTYTYQFIGKKGDSAHATIHLQ